jgi:hypothetical protein
VALAPAAAGIVKTGDPLSPPSAPAAADDVHKATKLVPDCGTLAQVLVTAPLVQPVVLPILVTMVPANGGPATPVMVSVDEELGIVNEQVGVVHKALGRAIRVIAAF